MKYVLIILVCLTSALFAQDTLSRKKDYKNGLGISLNQAIVGQITPPSYGYSYTPIFASSYYIEYLRVVHKMFYLNAGIGIFNTGYRYDVLGNVFNYNNYNLSIHLKPEIVMVNSKRILFYAGLTGQFNLYLVSFRLRALEGENLNIFQSDKELKRYNDMPVASVYGGFITGIGVKFGRLLVIAEPEFKVNMNALGGEAYYYQSVPYAVGINLKGFLRF